MAKLSILHLSDIHIGNNIYSKSEDIAIPIIEALEDHGKRVDCIVITGDIFDGKTNNVKDRKKVALDLFNYLKKELKNHNGIPLSASDFIIIPGNHDLNRTKSSADFDEYNDLLKGFYGEKYYKNNYNNKFLYTTKVFEDKKVAIIGLNSCMIESCKLEKKDTEWLKEIPSIDTSLKKEILAVLTQKKRNEWDDYGYISRVQLRDSFKHLESQIEDDISNYTVVACFHHHFYPFPEIYSEYGDSSIIRNFTDVIEKFQQKNVKIVLHGHKHLPIIRPVTNQKYLSNPESIFYVFSAGSVGKVGVTNRSFQQIDVYSPNINRIADVSRFNYKLEELQAPEVFRIPPQKKYEQNTYIELLSMFKEEFYEEYQKYKKEIYECDNISQQFRIDEIINNISRTITQFDSIKQDFKSTVSKIQMLLFAIHYRVNYLNFKIHKERSQKSFLNILKDQFSLILNDSDYEKMVFKLLESNRNVHFEKIYDLLVTEFTKFKDFTAYLTLAVFFTDLYLTFSRYGEIYYNDEKINHNVNIKLESDTFHENIPISTIRITSNVDRRLATIHFKCKNPTVHKIAVLIIKDFEKRINKIEDSFRQLGLKIYYLVPKVEKDNYDLDNLNFEAYIPTLLPLLTGENLYKKKEVFIRELIQNSLDAILLREDIIAKTGQQLNPDERAIKIIIGTSKNPKTGKDRKYLKIIDHGIGMDTFKIERYFTSIGRSFYVSDEFDELQKNENISYKPISNFGIGFLSAFMVCKEIEVVTKSYDNKDYGLEIHIPNYDGCFFIKKVHDKDLETGTTITLYEDNRKFLNPDKIIKYIKDIFCDFQLEIKINNKIKNKEEVIVSYTLRREKKVVLFCPIEDNNLKDVSWLNEIKDGSYIDKYQYGILLEFNPNNTKRSEKRFKHKNYLNSGILLSDSIIKDLDFDETSISKCYYNFPSSFIALDVAREKILSFKSKAITKNNVLKIFANQGIELMEDINLSNNPHPLVILNNISRFFKLNGASSHQIQKLNDNLYFLDFLTFKKDFVISLKKGITENSFVKPDFPIMIKIYYKVLFQVFESQPKLFNIKKYDFQEYLNHLDVELDNMFKPKSSHQLEPEFTNHFEKEFMNRFDDEFMHNFEGEFMHRFDEKIMHVFDEEFMHMFNDKFMHMFNDKFTHMFDEKFMHVFDEKFTNIFEKGLFRFSDKEFFMTFEKGFRSPKGKFHFQNNSFRENDEKYNLLAFLVLSNFMSEMRRGKRIHIRLGNIYGLFYLFYESLIRKMTVNEANKFRIVV